MQIEGSVAVVTGANRGIGAELVRRLRARGAARVYATARDAASIEPVEGVVPIQLDVTDQAQAAVAAAAAAAAADAQILINNAGIAIGQPLVGGDTTRMHEEFETNVFGPIYVSRAFAPVLKANGGGVIANALSAVSWFSFPGMASYSATKAAAWSLTDALRLELAEQGTTVLGYVLGPTRTELGDLFRLPPEIGLVPNTAEAVADSVLDAIEAGETERIVDEISRTVKSTLTMDPARYQAILGG